MPERCEPGRNFNYSPVDYEWQKKICNAFGWTLHCPSTPQNVLSEFQVSNRKPPKKDCNIVGDGNCFYRTISHIVTGLEDDWRIIKQAILNFIRDNSGILQNFFDSDPVRLYEVTEGKLNHSPNAARDFIQFHDRDYIFNDDIIAEFVAIMLKTPYYSYCPWQGWMSVTAVPEFEDKSEVWQLRHGMTYRYTANVQPSQKYLYLHFINNNHWEPAHNGLRSNSEE